MALQVFDFPYHKQSTEYPESGTRVQLGGNYIFTAPPSGPDLRRFTLKFETMVYYVGPTHSAATPSVDLVKNPQINLGRLEKFYNDHKLHKSFIYPHPVYGNVECKFQKPLKIPEGNENGNGSVKDFEVEFMEIIQ